MNEREEVKKEKSLEFFLVIAMIAIPIILLILFSFIAGDLNWVFDKVNNGSYAGRFFYVLLNLILEIITIVIYIDVKE